MTTPGELRGPTRESVQNVDVVDRKGGEAPDPLCVGTRLLKTLTSGQGLFITDRATCLRESVELHSVCA